MPQKNKNSPTRYSRAKPIGLRSQRIAKVRRSVKSVPAKRKRTVVKLSVAPLQVRLKSKKIIRPKRLASKYSARHVKVLRRGIATQFFRHALTRSAMVLVLLGLFTATLVSRASTDAQTYRALPTNCTGWNAADNVKTIEASSDANGQAIPADKSATIQSRKADQPASGDPQLKCKSFALPDDFPKDVAIRSAQLLVSLAVQGNPDSEDVLVLESSFDGQQWNKLDSFFLTEDMSNADHGGYWAYPFAKLEPDGIGTLQVRARFVSVPSDKQVSVRIDGMALEVDVRQMVSAAALNLPANVVQVEKPNVSTTDEPIVKVEVGKQARLKFLGFKDTTRSVDEVTVTTPEGTVQAASYDTQNITQGTTTYANLNIHTDKFTRPGKYTAQVTVLQDNKLAIVTTEFTWGVLVINMNRSVYWPGETVQFGMGVLDPFGHTVCDAKLTLTVVAPDGTKTVKTTEQAEKGVQRSTTCGRDNVTDVADYSAEYDTFDAGNYAVTLTAKTASGEYTITDTVVVSPVIPFAISRYGSMRIYPPAAYTMALDVRPQKAFKGIVEDYVPPSFEILKVSDGGHVIKGQQRTTIRWFVDWEAHTTHTLTYRYDAPDISPELFRLGPVQVGDYQESRQWQIASDATSGLGLLVYDEDGAANTTPHYRTWSGTDLSAEGQLADEETSSEDVNHTIVECSSARNECIRGALTADGHLDVQVWNGNTSTWSDGGTAPTNGDFTTGIGTTNDVYRGFDIAYEDSTGDGMVVYETSSSVNGTIMYRTWDGTNWSGEQTITYSGVASYVAGVAFWVELEADYGSDNILLAFYDGTNNDIYAMRWSGTAWVNSGSDLYTLITGVGAGNTRKAFDIAWEGTSGKGKIYYQISTGGNGATAASTYTVGSGWAGDSSTLAPAITTAVSGWLNIAGSPNNNYIAVIYVIAPTTNPTTASDVYVDMWNGTNWTGVTTPAGDTDINNSGYSQAADVAWEGGSSDRALFAWRDGTTSELYIRYMVFDIAGHALGSNVFIAPDDDGTGTAECNLTGTATDDNVATGDMSAAENSNGPCSAAAGMAWENEVQGIDLNSDPGSAKIMLVGEDLTADLKPEAQLWNGTAAGTWLTQTSNMNAFEIDLSQGATLSTSLPTKAYDFAFYRYSVVTISGTAYTSHTEGATLNSSGGSISIVNATTGAIASDADGTDGSGLWTILLQTPANGDILVLWLNGAATDGTLVLEYGASCTGTPDCTGLKLYQDNIIVRSEHTGNTITNTDLSTCDDDTGTSCTDTEIGFTSNLSGTYNLSTASGRRFFVWTGDTFDPGGTVTTHGTGGDFHVDDSAVAYLDTASAIGQDILVDGGATLHIDVSITVSGGDITTAGTSATVTYTGTPKVTFDNGTGSIGGGTTPSITFYDLEVNAAAVSIASTAAVNHDLRSVALATININADLTVGNDIIQGTGGAITTTAGTPTVTLTCTDATCGISINGQTGTFIIYNLTTSGTGTITLNRGLTISSDLAVGSGTTLTTANSPTLTMSGTTKTISGTGTKTLYALTISGSVGWSAGGTNTVSGAFSVSTGGAFTDAADISIGAGLANVGTGTIAYTGTPTLTATADGTIGGSASGTVQLYKLSVTGGTTSIGAASGGVDFDNLVTAATGGAIYITDNMSVGAGLTTTGTGTINSSGGIVTFTASGSLGGNDSGCSPATVVVAAGTLTQASNCALLGSASVASGAIWSGGTKNLSIVAATFDGDGTVTFTGGTVTIMHSTVWTTGTFGGSTAWTFNNLTIGHNPISYANASTTATGSGAITVNGTLTTEVHTGYPECGGSAESPGTCYITLDAGSKVWNLTGTGTVFTNAGRLLGSTSTFNYTNPTFVGANIGSTNSTTNNYYHHVNFDPTGSANTPTYTLSIGGFVADGNVVIGDSANEITLNGTTNNSAVTILGDVSCGTGFIEFGNAVTTGSGQWSIGGNFTSTNCFGIFTFNTGSRLTMTGSSKTITHTGAIYNLTIDPSAGGGATIFLATSNTVSNIVNIAANDQLTINSAKILTHTGATLTLNGTINGPGRYKYRSATDFPTTGTLAAALVLQFDTTANDIIMSERTDYQYVEIENSGSTAGRVVTLGTAGSQTLSIANNLTVQKTGASGNVTLTGATNAPAVNVTGDVSCGASNTKSLTTGAGTWTVSGNFTMTNCTTLTATADNTLVMNGTSKTLTSTGFTLQNVTLSGTITLASAVHTVNGNLVLSNTVTPGTSTVTMTGTANAITGGGFSLYNLTVDPSSAGTISLQTSDLTVTNTLNIATGDALTINASRTLTHTGATLTLDGTCNGPGRLIYRSTTAFPTTGTLATNLILQFDATANDQTLGARTDYQFVEIENSGTTAGRTVTAALGTITLDDDLTLQNTGADPSTTILQLDTNDPTFTVTGNTAIAANTTLTAPSGGGLFLKGNYTNSGTFTDSAGTVTLNGTGTQTLTGGMLTTNAFNNLIITNTSGAVSGCATSFTPGVAFATHATISGTYTITTGGVKVQYNSGSTYTVTNINWVGGIGNLIYFRNSDLSAGTWILNVSGTQTVQYVDVARSDASPGVDILATDGTSNDCNNNTGWIFTSGIDISGTSDGSSGTVKVAVNGSIQAQTTTLAGSWTITGVSVSSGNVVTVFVDAVAESAETTGVTLYDGTTNITGMVLNANVLTIGSDDNASLTLTNLGGIDNDENENIMHTANASVLTVDGGGTYSTEQVTIKASNTLTIGTTETLSTHHLNNAGILVGTGNATFDVFGNWTNSSTFTHNTSTVTFKAIGTGKTINNGASSFYNVIFNGSGGAWSALTNTLTITNDLTMTNGTFDTATGTANVVVNGNAQCGVSCGTINMTSTNTFTQSVAASKAFGTNVAVATDWTFYNLTFTASSGTPTITFNGTGTGQTIVANTLATTNSGTSLIVDNETNDRIIDANGAVTIGTGTTLQASSTAAFNVAGNWTNNGDFTDGTGTVTLDGGSQQTVDGQLTGANDRFNNLIITNASGSNPESSPSVIFAASADTASTFTAATASTKLRFLAGGTYTFQNISFNGGAIGTRVALRSSSTGTSWALNVAGTRTVTKIDVRDSNACGQAPNIDATDGTNFDSTGNSCWDINTLTFAINDVAVGFGTLSSTAATWANAGATGSASAVAAHTLAVTTNAVGGYALSYFGPTLVGAETIDAATFTGDADGTPNSKQFAMSITTDGSGTIPSAYQKASNNYSFVPSTTTTVLSKVTATPTTETASVYYMCNIASTTLPGAYSTAVTYILTGTF